jgi:hypothetical protein
MKRWVPIDYSRDEVAIPDEDDDDESSTAN